MKLVQVAMPGGGIRVGYVEGAEVLALPEEEGSLLHLVERALERRDTLDTVVDELLAGRRVERFSYEELDIPPGPASAHLAVPIHAPEVWCAGVTYRRSVERREEDIAKGAGAVGIYDRVYLSDRPELFFKATPHRLVGPNGYLCIRSDSRLTLAEPELAVVVAGRSRMLGYTICNDMTACDIERENPLYLAQAKVFRGCCALGPVVTTAADINNPHALEIRCTVTRSGETIFEGRTNTGEMKNTVDDLLSYLHRDNDILPGTVLSTGTGIILPDDRPLADGDEVAIEIDGIGRLVNPVRQL